MSKQDLHEVIIVGQKLHCQICEHNQFYVRKAQLNTAAASFFGVDWANLSADCYICANCGYIHWFLPMNKTA